MTRYVGLAEYVWLAEQVTGVEASVLAKASRIELADSALHAPAASFGGEEFYPELVGKAAVLTCRLAWNHPLPDGKQASRLGLTGDAHRLERRNLRPRSAQRRRGVGGHAGGGCP